MPCNCLYHISAGGVLSQSRLSSWPPPCLNLQKWKTNSASRIIMVSFFANQAYFWDFAPLNSLPLSISRHFSPVLHCWNCKKRNFSSDCQKYCAKQAKAFLAFQDTFQPACFVDSTAKNSCKHVQFVALIFSIFGTQFTSLSLLVLSIASIPIW